MSETEQSNAIQIGQICTVLSIEHEHGENVSVHTTSEGANAAAAKFAREWWHQIVGQADVPDEAPEDDAEAVSIYFDAQDGEWCNVYPATVEP
jgi:hypothetical protein